MAATALGGALAAAAAEELKNGSSGAHPKPELARAKSECFVLSSALKPVRPGTLAAARSGTTGSLASCAVPFALQPSPASFAAAACALGAVWSMHARRRLHARLLRRRLIARMRRRHCARRRMVRICGSCVALALISIWRGSHRRHSAPNGPAPSPEVCPRGRLRCARARRRQAAP